MSLSTESCHKVYPAAKRASKVQIACVMSNPVALPVPIIREPSFKSELHIPITSIGRAKRLSPHLYRDNSPTDPNNKKALYISGDVGGRLARRMSRDQMTFKGSSDSIHFRPIQDDTISLKSFRDGALSPFISKSPVWFKRKYIERQESQRRQMNCRDLGGSDCQGWLWKKYEGSGHRAKKWVIRWFELDRKRLRYYKHEEDDEPQGVIHLPGLKISPAPEVKSKKYAFKAHHSGTTFVFAAESQEDMVKWMNKMGLASLENLDLSRSSTVAGFLKPDGVQPDGEDMRLDDGSSGCLSDSDPESVDSLGGGSRFSSRPNSQRSSCTSSREDLVDLYSKLYDIDIGIDGSSIRAKRSTVFQSSSGENNEQKLCCRLVMLQRTLKDKEQQLEAINEFLRSVPITSEDIALFGTRNPTLAAELNDKVYTNDSTVIVNSWQNQESTHSTDTLTDQESVLLNGKSPDTQGPEFLPDGNMT